MASKPEERPASPPPVTWLAEPLKRFQDEAWHPPQGRLVREVIFGLNDGVISTIGFLAGVTATLSDVRTIALGGIAAAIAGAVAMGVGAFVSSKSQRAFFQAEIAREAWEIENMPEEERPVQAALELAGLGILACVIGLVLGWVVGVAV